MTNIVVDYGWMICGDEMAEGVLYSGNVYDTRDGSPYVA